MMDAKTCESCRHFRQHYVRYSARRYQPIRYGHCVFPRLKRRMTVAPACEYYEKREKGNQPEEVGAHTSLNGEMRLWK